MFKINYWETYIKTILIFKYFIVFTQTSLANLQSIQTETVIVKFSHIYCFANFNNNNYIVVHVFLGICMHIYRRRQWHPTPVLLPGKSHGQRSLLGFSPWGREESYMTEQLHFHFSLSCIGEGNGNPLQCSCLENPRDGGAWWAATYRVAQSRTRLEQLSSSSSMHIYFLTLPLGGCICQGRRTEYI